MKSKFTFFVLVSFLNLFAVSSVKASHSIGGEITYRWLGGNTYHFVLTFYRDCSGIPVAPTLNLNLKSSCGDNLNVTATLIPSSSISLSTCIGIITTCIGGTHAGVQKWQYGVDYTLPNQCLDWTFSYYAGCCNSPLSTNISNFMSFDQYIEAHLNDSLFNHDSPIFTADPQLYFCINSNQIIDCSVIGNECDSLVYSLIPFRYSPSSQIVYVSGFDPIHFISSSPPDSINAQTGMIAMHPTAIEEDVYVALVKQYRNGVFIGSIMRDVVAVTWACSNMPIYLPKISGINGTNQYSAIFPANATRCFNIFSSDSDTTQTTHLSLGESLPGDTLILDTMPHQSGVFCWTPLITDTGACPHCFSVNVRDDFCPPGTRNYKYCITVVDSGFSLNVNNVDSKYYVTVSPNPFSKSATVVVHGASPLLRLQFILFDALGRTVLNIPMDKNEMTIDGTLLPEGIYFYSVREDDTLMATGKLIITQ